VTPLATSAVRHGGAVVIAGRSVAGGRGLNRPLRKSRIVRLTKNLHALNATQRLVARVFVVYGQPASREPRSAASRANAAPGSRTTVTGQPSNRSCGRGPRVFDYLLQSVLARADSFTAGAIAAALIGFGTSGEVDVFPHLLSRYFGLALSTLFGMTRLTFGLAVRRVRSSWAAPTTRRTPTRLYWSGLPPECDQPRATTRPRTHSIGS
jgi:hypothetical protein